jgi:hypothetical protein
MGEIASKSSVRMRWQEVHLRMENVIITGQVMLQAMKNIPVMDPSE